MQIAYNVYMNELAPRALLLDFVDLSLLRLFIYYEFCVLFLNIDYFRIFYNIIIVKFSYGGPPQEGIPAVIWKDDWSEQRLQLDLYMLRG